MIISSENDIAYLAKEALRARLYVNGWTMESELKRAARDSACIWYRKIAIYKDGDKAIGAAILDDIGLVNIFVRKRYRRMGIGKKLIDAVKVGEMQGCYGIKGSLEFFKAVGVTPDLEDE